MDALFDAAFGLIVIFTGVTVSADLAFADVSAGFGASFSAIKDSIGVKGDVGVISYICLAGALVNYYTTNS